MWDKKKKEKEKANKYQGASASPRTSSPLKKPPPGSPPTPRPDLKGFGAGAMGTSFKLVAGDVAKGRAR